MIRSLVEHLLQKHHVIVQGLGSQLPKFWQSLYSGDLGQLELHLQRLLDLSGGCGWIKKFIDFIRKIREWDLDGRYGIREKRSRSTTELLKST